jgi:hypothetical protein
MILNAVIGALFRRYWGGWGEWPHPSIVKHYFKIVLGHILCPIIVFTVSVNIEVALISGTIIALGWWALPYHAWGTWMGDTNGATGEEHPLWACILVIAARYGIISLSAGLSWYLISGQIEGLIYIAHGFFAWVPYLVAKKFGRIEDYTATGELGLGALMLGI